MGLYLKLRFHVDLELSCFDLQVDKVRFSDLPILPLEHPLLVDPMSLELPVVRRLSFSEKGTAMIEGFSTVDRGY